MDKNYLLPIYGLYTEELSILFLTLVSSSDGFAGVVLGRSTSSMPVIIFVVILKRSSSGIGILRLKDLYDRLLYA
ncbi:MAG TPA: hypothetical protein VH796_14215 [Nitrososphaeraceae archaeon]